MTGWRVGYLTASSKWIPTIGYFNDLVYICAPGPMQCGAVAGMVGLSRPFYDALALEYQQKRDQLCAALNDAALTPAVPEGAYYILADASRIPGETAPIKARKLLAETGVAAVAGSAFYVDGGGETLLRFCFGKRPEALDRACAALRSF